MVVADERLAAVDFDPELLVKLTLQSVEALLAGFELAARELPTSCEMFSRRTLRKQDPALLIEQGPGHHVSGRSHLHTFFFFCYRKACERSAFVGQRSVAMLVLLARAAGTRFIATDLAGLAHELRHRRRLLRKH